MKNHSHALGKGCLWGLGSLLGLFSGAGQGKRMCWHCPGPSSQETLRTGYGHWPNALQQFLRPSSIHTWS